MSEAETTDDTDTGFALVKFDTCTSCTSCTKYISVHSFWNIHTSIYYIELGEFSHYGDGLQAGCPRNCGSIPSRGKIFFCFSKCPDKLGVGVGGQPMSYSMGTGGSFPGVKQPGCEPDHLVPRLRMSGTVRPLPHMLS
jgi:hypothetical protein